MKFNKVKKPERIGWRNKIVCGNTLKPKITSNGYYMVVLSKDNKNNYKNIHRIVAGNFIPNLYNKPQVNHKDGNKLNNNVENLEWNTSKENIDHAKKLGLRNYEGNGNPSSKLSESDVLEIRKKKNWNYGDRVKLGKKYGVSGRCIAQIINRDTWRHIK